MPNKQYIRERVIRLIQERAPIARRTLEKTFPTSLRGMASEAVSGLINENYIAITGRGKRGDPEVIVQSGGWPARKCPLCGKE